MLTHLHIENYALIKKSDIEFGGSFVAITGETGAGKSILLGALGLLLGQRSDTKSLYDPTRKCIVEAQFNVKEAHLRTLFEENDVDYSEEGDIIIRREILPTAKSRAFVNDTPVALSFLKELGCRIIDIHSQHATLLLGNSNFQTSLLDNLGDSTKTTLFMEYQAKYKTYISLKRELEKLTAEEQQSHKDYDYNKFLFDELEQAHLNDGEQEELEQESRLLANAENIKQTLSQIESVCDGEEDSALSRINLSKNLLSKLGDCHPDIVSLHERMDSALIELRDIIATLEQLNEGITWSPERQEAVDERLDLIYRLQKKHGVNSMAELLEIKKALEGKLTFAGDMDQKIKEVMEAVDAAYSEVRKSGKKLSAAREAAARQLEHDIAPLLTDLGMSNATLKAEVERLPDYGPDGNDRVTLLFNANKGGQPRELSKVASGGEMSRLMLAVKALTTRASLLPTVIFDEIDAGISGDISVKVGHIMQRMAEHMQVIAITHLPQIAAHAQRHYKVYKTDEEGVTASKIMILDDKQRQHEIAVMLSAEPPTKAALQTAQELLNLK